MKCFRFFLFWMIISGVSGNAQTYFRKEGNSANAVITESQKYRDSDRNFSGVFADGFEAYDDFAHEYFPWKTVDLDGRPTWGIESVTFPNQYSPMSFIIFNPSATNPPMAGPAIQPLSGRKIAACFSANTSGNNDWLISPQFIAGTNTNVSFYVKSYTSQYGLERFRVGISTTDDQPASFTFLTGPNYLTAPADAWELKTFDLNNYNGQAIYIAINCISDQSFIFMVDDFRFTTTLPEVSIVTGLVTDATTGEPIPGAEVCISGLCTLTDEQGNYLIDNIPPGRLEADFTAHPTFGSVPLEVQFTDQSTENTHNVSCTKTGYLTYINNQVSLEQGGSLALNISLSPVLQEGNLRFVLNWGPLPSDLDSHLLTPEIEGEKYHIYYDNEGSVFSAPYALLDYDITTGFGPETMTIYQLKPGFYRYYVQNFSQNPALSQSRAVVQIYGAGGLQETVQVPGTGSGNFWHVCDVNGETGEILLVNVIQHDSPLGFLHTKSPEPTKLKENLLYINSWLWDFGDGNTSNKKNPNHTYNQTGNFTVSLTVGNGVNQSTKVKPLYVQVGTQSDKIQIKEDFIKLYPVPVREALLVESELTIQKIEIFSMNGNIIYSSIPDNYRLIIDTSAYIEGIYLILIHTSAGSIVRKFNKI